MPLQSVRPAQSSRLPWLALGCLAVCTIVVQPFRFAVGDDDWAYAWTVKHLADTGHYKLNDWLAANMPFQAYWGLLFAKIFGYSFATLRFSTMCFAFAGLIAFYYLAQEMNLPRAEASLLTLVLASSPLIIRLTFTFMTDVPFVMMIIVALLLYAVALRRGSVRWMLSASLAAAASILIRQFGVALVGGLLLLWALDAHCRRQPMLFASGALLPTLAGFWQLRSGLVEPNWAARGASLAQQVYLSDPRALLLGLVWRPPVILQYLALFCAPLMALPVLAAYQQLVASRPRQRRVVVVTVTVWAGLGVLLSLIAVAWIALAPIPGFGARRLYVLGGGFLVALAGARLRSLTKSDSRRTPVGQEREQQRILPPLAWLALVGVYLLVGAMCSGKWLLPYIPWGFQELALAGYYSQVPITLVTVVGGVIFAWHLISGYSHGWREMPAAERFVHLSSLCLFGAHLLFFKLGDEYLLDLLPVSILVLGQGLKVCLSTYRKELVTMSFLCAIVWAQFTRGSLAFAEANWKLGRALMERGERVNNIYTDWTWTSYHRFADYLVDIDFRPMAGFNDYFYRWLPEQARSAKYYAVDVPASSENSVSAVVSRMAYRDAYLNQRVVVMVRRDGASVR